MGKYDSFWTDVVQRGQVALNVNMPLYRGRRDAAVREAMHRVNKLQAEYEQQIDLIRNDVQSSYARVEAGRRTLELYTEKILPAAQGNVEAASSGYTAGTVDFLRLVQAQRELIELNEKYQQAIVDYNRNRAELDRVVGTAFCKLDSAINDVRTRSFAIAASCRTQSRKIATTVKLSLIDAAGTGRYDHYGLIGSRERAREIGACDRSGSGPIPVLGYACDPPLHFQQWHRLRRLRTRELPLLVDEPSRSR